MSNELIKIISGGQTGVDRGALDAALTLNVPCGGWCPEGRKAEDGVIPERYPLDELVGAGYRRRTKQNVIDSDVTIVIYFEKIVPRRGTELTIKECVKQERPHLLIDGANRSEEDAAREINKFCRLYGAKRINFAGPSGGGLPHAHGFTQKVVEGFIRLRLEIV